MEQPEDEQSPSENTDKDDIEALLLDIDINDEPQPSNTFITSITTISQTDAQQYHQSLSDHIVWHMLTHDDDMPTSDPFSYTEGK